MKHFSYKLFLITIFISTILHAQFFSEKELNKLHPQFKSLLSKLLPDLNIKSSFPQTNILQKENSDTETFGAIIYTSSPDELKAVGIQLNSTLPQFVTTRISVKDLMKIIPLESVKYITPGLIEYLHNDVASGCVGADLLHSGYVNSTAYKGSNVIVCIIDTGIDWDHYDFRNPSDPTKSRIIDIWDQTLSATGSEIPPTGFSYGVEYSNTEINDELNGTPAGFVRESDINGHGTHVAGTTAGNGSSLNPSKYIGMAPEADILVVKAGNGSFSSSNIIDALTYAQQKATLLGKPIVVNMSLGSDAGPHDGTDSKSVAINNFSGTGRVVVVSAGNSGSSNIHISGTISNGGSANITLTIPSYTAISGSNNDNCGMDFWFSNNGNVTVSVTTPNSYTQSQVPGGDATTHTNDGSMYLYNYIDAGNNDREIEAYFYDGFSIKPPYPGTWTITLTNNSGASINYHGWLFDASIGTSGTVLLNGGNTSYTLGNSAADAIIVGSYVSRWRWYSSDGNSYSYSGTDYSDNISSFSSLGPTRTGSIKPDITAPGQAIISSRSSDTSPDPSNLVAGNLHLKNQGTSMASPVVAGCVALLLQENPNLTSSDISSIIKSTAYTDSYTGSSLPNSTWGYGKLNIYRAMMESINPGFDNNWEVLAYDQWGSESSEPINADDKIAVRFTPTFDGNIAGLFFHPSTTLGLTSPLYAEIWSNNSGLPNVKLGNTVSFDQNKILKFSWNYIDMTGSGVNVSSGNDYHAVLYFSSGTTTNFRFENISIDNRSSINTGSGWIVYTNDFRIRPIIAKDISALPIELTNFTVQVQTDNYSAHLCWKTFTEKNSFGFEVERRESFEINSLKDKWANIDFIKSCGNSTSPRDYTYIDKSISKAGKYYYRLKMVDNDGSFKYSEEAEADFSVPSKFNLSQNFPNPFNPKTIINFELASSVVVSLKIYDILGNELETLINKETAAGKYSVEFDGSKLSNGIYFYKLITPDFTNIKKMVLLK